MCPGGLVPLAYTVGVANDGKGLGEEVTIPAGKHSDVALLVPVGTVLRWRWGAATDDLEFSVSCAPAADASTSAASTAAVGVTRVTRSVLGVQQLSPDYTGPVPHGLHRHIAPRVCVSHDKTDGTDALHGAAAGAPITHVVPAKRSGSHIGEHTVAAAVDAVPGAVNDKQQQQQQLIVVRLRWSNAFSWLTSKALARRIDVLLPSSDASWVDLDPELDSAERQAQARTRNIAVMESSNI